MISKIKRLKVTDYAALRCEISLKVTCEIVEFSNCGFCNNFRYYNVHTHKLFEKILDAVQTKGAKGR